MENVTEKDDPTKYGYEARIYSIDGKYERKFTDKDFVEDLNACKHPTQLKHAKKDVILKVEGLLLPLKSRAARLILETKGGSVIARMTLEDFFNLLELAKRIEIVDRYHESGSIIEEPVTSPAEEIQDFLQELDNE